MVQSTFDAIIDDDQYLMQLYPDPYLFFSTMPDESELTKHYRKLLDSIMSLQMKKNRNVTLPAVKRRGDLMDLKIIDLPADDAVLDIDDVEFFDWSKNNSSSRLWYCEEVVSSPMLLTAIQNAIERSPTDYLAKKMSLITDVQPHFLGFVSAQMQDTIVKSFHLNSFVLYYPNAEVVDEDVAYSTVVILTHTSRIHIL